MNRIRRKKLEVLRGQMLEQIEEWIEALDDIRDKEDEAFYNLPDGNQRGERGEKMEKAISALDDVITELESVSDTIEESFEVAME